MKISFPRYRGQMLANLLAEIYGSTPRISGKEGFVAFATSEGEKRFIIFLN